MWSLCATQGAWKVEVGDTKRLDVGLCVQDKGGGMDGHLSNKLACVCVCVHGCSKATSIGVASLCARQGACLAGVCVHVRGCNDGTLIHS